MEIKCDETVEGVNTRPNTLNNSNSATEISLQNDISTSNDSAEDKNETPESNTEISDNTEGRQLVAKLLNIMDFKPPPDPTNTCNVNCPNLNGHAILKERITDLEDAVKSLSTICGTKEVQLDLQSEELQAYRDRINNLQNQLAKELEAENTAKEQEQTQKVFLLLAKDKNMLKEKVQRLESKNKSLTETVQEVSADFLKTEYKLQNEKMKLKNYIEKLSKTTDIVIPCEIKNILNRGLPKSSKSNENEVQMHSKSVQTESPSNRRDHTAENFQFSSILQRNQVISWPTDCDSSSPNSMVSNLQETCSQNHVDVPQTEIFPSHNSDITMCHSRVNSQTFFNDMSGRVKKTKKTVSWSDQVLGNSLASPDNKVFIKGTSKQFKKTGSKQYDSLSTQTLGGKPRNKHNRDRRKKLPEAGHMN